MKSRWTFIRRFHRHSIIVNIHLGISQWPMQIIRYQPLCLSIHLQPVLVHLHHLSIYQQNLSIPIHQWSIHISIDVIVCVDIYALFHSSSPSCLAESTLSTPLYPTATTPLNYPPPSTFYYGWNSHPSTSLIRTHSASFQDYSPYLVNFNSTTTNQDKTMTTGSRLLTVGSHSIPPPPPPTSMSSYASMMNFLPPVQHSASSSTTTTTMKPPSHSSKTTTKRPRLTAHLRSEILKLKRQKPTAFAWEIQQNLLQQGICTSQTLPSVNWLIFFSKDFVDFSSIFRRMWFNEFWTNLPKAICINQ